MSAAGRDDRVGGCFRMPMPEEKKKSKPGPENLFQKMFYEVNRSTHVSYPGPSECIFRTYKSMRKYQNNLNVPVK